jgi:hypothetical protein
LCSCVRQRFQLLFQRNFDRCDLKLWHQLNEESLVEPYIDVDVETFV